MTLADIIYGGDNQDPDQQLINKALGTYFRAKFAHDVGDRAINRIFPTAREELQDKEMKLSIMTKRRALGLPLSDDDYELASNEGIPFKTLAPTLFGKEVEQLIPEPAFMRNSARVPRTLSAIFGTAFKATPEGKAANAARAIFRTARSA